MLFLLTISPGNASSKPCPSTRVEGRGGAHHGAARALGTVEVPVDTPGLLEPLGGPTVPVHHEPQDDAPVQVVSSRRSGQGLLLLNGVSEGALLAQLAHDDSELLWCARRVERAGTQLGGRSPQG